MSGKILLVDDSDLNRLLLRDVLTQHGYTVLTAADGAEGVRMARAEKPDLILMDIQMPRMNGLDAGKLLRADPVTRGIRLLALSSFNLLADDTNFFTTEFDGYIAKPVDIRKLPETVKKHLNDEETS